MVKFYLLAVIMASILSFTKGDGLEPDEWDNEFLTEINKIRKNPMSIIPELEELRDAYGDNLYRMVEINGQNWKMTS